MKINILRAKGAEPSNAVRKKPRQEILEEKASVASSQDARGVHPNGGDSKETKEEERRVTLWVNRDVSRSPDAAPENASGAEVATSTALSRAEEQRDSISTTLSL